MFVFRIMRRMAGNAGAKVDRPMVPAAALPILQMAAITERRVQRGILPATAHVVALAALAFLIGLVNGANHPGRREFLCTFPQLPHGFTEA